MGFGLGDLLGAALPIGGGILGGIIGGGGSQQNQTQRFGVNAPLSALGQQSQTGTGNAYQAYQNLVNSQSGSLMGAPEQYANMLQQYAKNGGVPNEQQVGYANQYAQNIFAPQQAQLNNVFNQAQVNTNRSAAQLGRSINDPILQAKLAQYQGQQQNVLSGQQTALASQFAQQLPNQQLGYAQLLNNQAFQNQQNVMGLGQGILKGEQGYSLGMADRTGTQNGQSGGGLGGALSGILSGAGGGLNMMNILSQIFGGGGGGALNLAGTDAALGAGATEGIGALGAGDLIGGGAAAAGGFDLLAALGSAGEMFGPLLAFA